MKNLQENLDMGEKRDGGWTMSQTWNVEPQTQPGKEKRAREEYSVVQQ